MSKTGQRRIYMVCRGGKYRMATRLRDAKRIRQANEGAEIRTMPIASWNECSWDYPTFHLCSDPLETGAAIK